jgi:hypothetical protein
MSATGSQELALEVESKIEVEDEDEVEVSSTLWRAMKDARGGRPTCCRRTSSAELRSDASHPKARCSKARLICGYALGLMDTGVARVSAGVSGRPVHFPRTTTTYIFQSTPKQAP